MPALPLSQGSSTCQGRPGWARGPCSRPRWARDRDAQAAALTHGHVIVRSVGESQQQFLPLAAQLIGLVLGLQLHLCRTRGEAAMKP